MPAVTEVVMCLQLVTGSMAFAALRAPQQRAAASSTSHMHRHWLRYTSGSSMLGPAKSPEDNDASNITQLQASFELPYRAEIEAALKYPVTEIALAALVFASCLLFSLQTLDGTVGGPAGPVAGGVDLGPSALALIDALEAGIGLLFLIEFALRWYGEAGMALAYLATPLALVDGLVVLPTILKLLGVKMIMGGVSFEFLRLLRVLRLQRFLANAASFERTFGKVWAGAGSVKGWQLEAARIVKSIVTLLFVASGLMYEAEKGVNPGFTDFFVALYFGLTTLTTVGFGDIAPVTPAGRAVVSLSILFGVTIIPVQLSALANAVIRDTELRNVVTSTSTAAVQPQSPVEAQDSADMSAGVMLPADDSSNNQAGSPGSIHPGGSDETTSFLCQPRLSSSAAAQQPLGPLGSIEEARVLLAGLVVAFEQAAMQDPKGAAAVAASAEAALRHLTAMRSTTITADMAPRHSLPVHGVASQSPDPEHYDTLHADFNAEV